MPTNVSHAGCATERAGDTTTARSYRASFAERERLHLRFEFHFGRRAFKPTAFVATPLDQVRRLRDRAVSKARCKWDTDTCPPRAGQRQWESLKSVKGYDAQVSRTELARFLLLDQLVVGETKSKNQ